MNIPSNLQISDIKNLSIFLSVVGKAQDILSNALFPHYTDHSLNHSERVLNLASYLLNSSIILSEDERFVLLCAIVLHDIGMQTNNYLDGSTFPLSNEQLETIRKNHHEFSFRYITEEYISLGLSDKRNLVHYIALVAKNHRSTDLEQVTKAEHYHDGIIRLQLLSAIIRLADCLDCDSRRVNIHLLNGFQIEPESKAYWFCHYYVQSIYIENRKANLVFAFPEEYKDNDIHRLIINFMSNEVKSQTDKLYDILSEHGIVFHRELVSTRERYLKAILPMPNDVCTYIKENFNDNVIKQVSIGNRNEDCNNANKDTQLVDTDVDEYSSFLKITIPNTESHNANRFYDGFQPTTVDLKADYDFSRAVYIKENGIKAVIENILDQTDVYTKFILIRGVVGSGTSTLLKRIAFDFCKFGKSVFQLNADWQEDSCIHTLQYQIKKIAEYYPECIIVIDDIADLIEKKQINLLELFNTFTSKKILFILAEKPNKWNAVASYTKSLASTNTLNIFDLHQLDEWECEQLVEKMIELETNGKLAIRHLNLSKEERLAVCQKNSDRHFVVAMHQLRYGQHFSDIIVKEYHNIASEQGKELYLMTCFCDQLLVKLPCSIAYSAIHLERNVEMYNLLSSIDGVLKISKNTFSTRHARISKEVFINIFKTKEQAYFLLTNLLSSMSKCKNINDIQYFLNSLFSSSVAPKQIVEIFEHDFELIEEFIYMIDELSSFGNDEINLAFLVFQANIQRKIKNNIKALALFKQAIGLDPLNDYAYRQMAWIEHEVQSWDSAIEYAKESLQYKEKNPKHILQTATIFSLNRIKYFREARYYYELAVQTSNYDDYYIKKLQQYDDASTNLKYISSLDEEDLLPYYIADIISPPISFYRNYFSCNSKEYRKKLILALERMSSHSYDNSEELVKAIDGFNINGDRLIKSKYYGNLARLKYIQWYRNEFIVNAEDIFNMFKLSLELNDSDAFNHCWLGTYYKEVIKDYCKAENEYLKAISLAETSNMYVKNHPIFTNNLGLLIMDGVVCGYYTTDRLVEARKLFLISIEKDLSTGGGFYWANYNLSRCIDLIRRYKDKITA